MIKKSRRMKEIISKIDFSKKYSIKEAIVLIKNFSSLKFKESIDVALNLNLDTKRSDNNIKGTVILPHGHGRINTVAVFTQGENIEIAKSAGADYVGMEDLFDKIVNGFRNFNVVIASLDAMKLVGKLGSILGPRNLMPNPKLGTVTQNIFQAVQNAKFNQIFYKNDKNGIIHSILGKMDFSENQIKENLEYLISIIKKNKSKKIKQFYIKKISLSSTMGISVNVDQTSLII